MSETRTCQIKECKQVYRAKGYCNSHYKKWRQGELPHSRYRTCKNDACRKREFKKALCEDHYNAKYSKKVEAPAAAAPASEAAPAA